MQFYNTTKAFVEKECVKNHEKDICSVGTGAFIITVKSSKINGSLNDICSILKKNNIPYHIFDDVEENPSTTTVYKASRIGIEHKSDFVIGIGGGSPLDAAKAIAMLIKNPEKKEDCLLHKTEELDFLPVITVPTTCGTGAEITPNAVLTYHAEKKKGSMPYKSYPVLALIDGKYILNAPRQLVINTAIDALSHALESYLNTSANPYNFMFSKYALELWKDCKDILKKETLDIDSAQHLMLTSTIAGMAISQTGTSLPHYFGYDFTYAGYASHGHACGIFQPSYLKEYEKHDSEPVKEICNYLGFKDVNEFDEYMKSNLPEVKVKKETIYPFIQKVSNTTSKLKTFPFEISYESIESMYKDAITLID